MRRDHVSTTVFGESASRVCRPACRLRTGVTPGASPATGMGALSGPPVPLVVWADSHVTGTVVAEARPRHLLLWPASV